MEKEIERIKISELLEVEYDRELAFFVIYDNVNIKCLITPEEAKELVKHLKEYIKFHG